MVIEHNEVENMKENRMTHGEIRATAIYFTRPKFEFQGQQSPNFFGKKYIEHLDSSITKLLEPLTEKRQRQKAYIVGLQESRFCRK